jgi:hypothetical protein
MVPPSVTVLEQTYIEDNSPFHIYHIQIAFLGATHLIFKQFTNFVDLQKKLLESRSTSCLQDENTTLEKCLPKLNAGGLFSYFESAETQVKRESDAIEKFSSELLKLVVSDLFDLKENFIKRIVKFFEFDQLIRKKNSQQNTSNSALVNSSLTDLPQPILTHILSFCTKTEVVSIATTCKQMYSVSMSPFLWKRISLKAKSDIVDDDLVEKITKNFNQLTTFNLSFCDEIGHSSALAISQNCNPLHLRELNLDGCKRIGDEVLKHLALKFVDKRSNSFEEENDHEPECQLHDTNKEDLESIHSSHPSEKKSNPPEIKPSSQIDEIQPATSLISHRPTRLSFDSIVDEKTLQGGARGLKKISLSECKQVTDRGLKQIAKMTNLRSLSLQSCHHVTDKGVRYLLERCHELEEINLGGTQITMKTIDFILSNCPSIKRLGLKGCDEINEISVKMLEEKNIEVDYGESICQFLLMPEKENELPTITNNLFKGRSTLSIHRVKNFLEEKLKKLCGKDIKDIEFVCNKKVLEEHYTLHDVKTVYQRHGQSEIVLLYRRKKPPTKNLFTSVKPRAWTSKKNITECMNSECKQNFGISHVKFNCHLCGQVYCDRCTQYKTCIRKLGYDDPAKVCVLCWLASKERD